MTKDELRDYIVGHFEGKLTLLDTGRYDQVFEVKPGDLISIARALRDDERLRFDYLCCISAVDTGERFEAVYSLASIINKHRVDIKTVFPYDAAELDSMQEVWPAANWYEREMWELFGINIRNHGNLTCFLLPEDWNQGHPMRKNWDAPDFVRLPEL